MRVYKDISEILIVRLAAHRNFCRSSQIMRQEEVPLVIYISYLHVYYHLYSVLNQQAISPIYTSVLRACSFMEMLLPL